MINRQIIKLQEVKNLTRLSAPTIYRLMANNKFPKQIKLAERSSGWIEEEVKQYLENRIKDRGV